MTTTHKPIGPLYGGDDFRFHIQIVDENKIPYDLSKLNWIKWLLHNDEGLIWEHEFLLSHADAAAGRLMVWLPHADTTRFPGGLYTDFLRINCNGIVSTLLTGPITIIADPWKASVAVAPFAAMAHTENVVVMLDRRERVRRRRAA